MHEYYTIDNLYNDYKRIFESYQLRYNNFKEVFEDKGLSVIDFGMFVFETIISEIEKTHKDEKGIMYKKLKEIYFNMAIHQRRYFNNKGNTYYSKFIKYDLLEQYLTTTFLINVTVLSKNCCTYCDSINDLKAPIIDVVKKPLIYPSKCKNRNGCNAIYLYQIVRDSNGNIEINT